MIVVIALLSVVWFAVAVTVVLICKMAASADDAIAAASADDALTQRPRRPSTWGTVRRRILMSPQSDQLATYK
jgi:hypothetical protein